MNGGPNWTGGMNCLRVFLIWGTYPVFHGREDRLVNRDFTVCLAMSPSAAGGSFHGIIY